LSLRQQVYLENRLGKMMNIGGTLFWMQDPIILPSPKYTINLSVPFAAMPLTHYAITEANRRLQTIYMCIAPLIIDLCMGNHSIDELVDVLNRNLLFGFTAGYSESLNTLHFSTENFSADLVIEPLTACADRIEACAEDTSVIGSYYAPGGVNLAGIISFYICLKYRTRNRDLRALCYSSIIASTPITKPHNGLERSTMARYSFGFKERSINYTISEILDDAVQPMPFQGGV